MELMVSVFAVALLGGIGSVARYMIGFWNGVLPWGILAANTVASFIAGVAISAGQLQIALIVGLAGGLSTFSTFAAQTSDLVVAGKKVLALTNSVLNLGLPSAALLTASFLL
jgi:CrcB protein